MGVDERTNKEAFSTVFKWQFEWKSFMMPKSLLNTVAAFLSYFMRYIATTQLHFQKDNFLQGAFFPFEFVRVKGCELSLTNAIILKRFALVFVAVIAFIRTSIYVHYSVHCNKNKFLFSFTLNFNLLFPHKSKRFYSCP